MPVRRVVAAAAAATLLVSCGSGTSSTGGGSPGPSASAPHTVEPSPTDTGSTGAGGSPEDPVVLVPGTETLAWRPVPGPTSVLVTVGDGWRLSVPQAAGSARLDGAHPRTVEAGPHARISTALLDDRHALVVSEDSLARTADVATLVDLATGRATVLDDGSDPPTAVGGTWALGPGTLLHATTGDRRRYCLATVDLSSGTGTTGWCAEPRHGFSRAAVTTAGTTMMTFDDHRPSCRTLVRVTGDQVSPLPGVADCIGWDSLAVDDGAVWSVVPNQRRIEQAHLYAHVGDAWYDLGRGTSGTVVGCAGSAYFVRDPARSTDPARLLRFDPADGSLAVVFASRGHGRAFLTAPRCGGEHLTVTALAAAGDQQVTARLN